MIEAAGDTERASTGMKKVLISGALLLGFLLISFNSVRSADELKPPSIYVDKGACPFECCTYREWVARTDLTLLDSPDGKKAVAQIKKGEKVLAMTGEIHSVPLQIVSPPRLSRCRSEGRRYALHSSLPRGGLLEGLAQWTAR